MGHSAGARICADVVTGADPMACTNRVDCAGRVVGADLMPCADATAPVVCDDLMADADPLGETGPICGAGRIFWRRPPHRAGAFFQEFV